MPLFKRTPEDAPASGDPAANLADKARLRTQSLTQELLDWCIVALEAVLSTPEVRDVSERRAAASLRTALKYVDHLYPLTLRKEPADEAVPPTALGADSGTAGRDEADSEGGAL